MNDTAAVAIAAKAMLDAMMMSTTVRIIFNPLRFEWMKTNRKLGILSMIKNLGIIKFLRGGV